MGDSGGGAEPERWTMEKIVMHLVLASNKVAYRKSGLKKIQYCIQG